MTPDTVAIPQTIILIGPPTDSIGGMASVVEQMLGMSFAGRYRFEPLYSTQRRTVREPLGARVIRHIRQVRRFQAVIGRTGASIVHIHTCSGFSFYRSALDMLAARRRGCRVILHIHGARFDAWYADEPAWRRRLVRWGLERADRVVVLSPGWRRRLGCVAPGARYVVVENGVATPPVVSGARREGPCRFVLLARMDTWKGIDDLLDACARLRHRSDAIEVTLAGPAGTAGDAGVLGGKIRARGLASFVRYMGEVRGDAKAELLAGADVYIQPSHHEGMPIALLEALARGLPAVATRVGAVPEVVEDGRQGRLVPPHRPDRLAAAMEELACDRVLRSAMSRAARALAVDRFSLDRLRDDLAALYDGLTVPRPGRAVAHRPNEVAGCEALWGSRSAARPCVHRSPSV